ncbi:hypothetical protein LSAT2_024399 [Lamellibrachia satsuma]|nr:hypothetical protein LSAT2_024399 [Lamellibrachia satsuma]
MIGDTTGSPLGYCCGGSPLGYCATVHCVYRQRRQPVTRQQRQCHNDVAENVTTNSLNRETGYETPVQFEQEQSCERAADLTTSAIVMLTKQRPHLLQCHECIDR